MPGPQMPGYNMIPATASTEVLCLLYGYRR